MGIRDKQLEPYLNGEPEQLEHMPLVSHSTSEMTDENSTSDH